MSNQYADVAGTIILNDKQEVLLLHRNTPELQQWETPGGKVESNESLEDAAARETLEELGVGVRLLGKLATVEFENEWGRWRYTWFLAEIADGDPSPQEEHKHDAVDYFDWGELRKLADSSIAAQLFLEQFPEPPSLVSP